MYVAVLGSSVLITVIATSALMATRIERRGAEDVADLAKARYHARTGIEMGLFRIGTDANWRTNRTSGPWETNKPVGTGSYTLSGVDPSDGDLSDDVREPVRLLGTGSEGHAKFTLGVMLDPTVIPLDCLEVSVQVGNNILLPDSTTITGDQIISANNDFNSGVGVTVTPDMEAGGVFVGAVGPGTTTSGVTPRSLPDPATVFDYYLAHGTSISIASLDNVGGVQTIYRALLSPSNNDYGGGTNGEGIYVIDCQGLRMDIEESRIVGTLVLLNLDPLSEVRGSVHWEPAVANFPALMVSGNYNVNMSAVPLSEADVGANFNPAGTQYLGADDASLDDTYPSTIGGIVYVLGNLTTFDDVTLDGVLVVEYNLSVTGNLSVTYRSGFFSDPPPGFIDRVQMGVVPGSWQQVVN